MKNVKSGDKVAWNWGNGEGEGTVQSVTSQKVIKTLKGAKVTRNGTKDNPAVVIESEKGKILKKASELHKA